MKKLFAFSIACITALTIALGARADYPEKPIKVIYPYPPGGAQDLILRLLGEQLQPKLGQPIVVENRPGAAGQVGSAIVAAAEPDGYTLMYNAIASFSPTFRKSMPFDYTRPFTPVAVVTNSPHAFSVNLQVPVKSLAEFVAYAKANRGKVDYAGAGSTPFLTAEMFKAIAGIDLNYIPYKGSVDVVKAVRTNEVHLAVGPLAVGDVQYMRPLAVAARTRLPGYPDLPTMAEAGFPQIVAGATLGFWAPMKTSRDIVLRLNKEINAITTQSAFRERVKGALGDGTVLLADTPEAYGQILANEQRFWAEAAKIANFKPE
jgi:tripartite-type tricarboxylate transporter receptor subunit TctC